MEKSTKHALGFMAFGGVVIAGMVGFWALLDWLIARYDWFFEAVGYFLVVTLVPTVLFAIFRSIKRDFEYMDRKEDEQP